MGALVLMVLKKDGNRENPSDWQPFPCPLSGSLVYDVYKGNWRARWVISYRHSNEAKLTDGETVAAHWIWNEAGQFPQKLVGPDI